MIITKEVISNEDILKNLFYAGEGIEGRNRLELRINKDIN